MDSTNQAQPVVLAPISDWFGSSWRICTTQWLIWMIANGLQMVGSIVVMIGMALGLGLPILLYVLPMLVGKSLLSGSATLVLIALSLLTMFVILLLFAAWANAAVTLGMSYGTSSPAPVGKTFKVAFHSIMRAFILNVVLLLISLGSIACGVVPFLMIFPGIVLAWYIGILENKGVEEALTDSWRRTRGYRWDIFWRFLLLLIGVFVAFAAADMLRHNPVVGWLVLPFNTILQMIAPVMSLAGGMVIYNELLPKAQDPAVPQPVTEEAMLPFRFLQIFVAIGTIIMGILLLKMTHIIIPTLPALRTLV